MPEPPGGVVQVPSVALGVDHKDACEAHDEVVDVGDGPGDGEVVENLVAVALQWGEQAGGAPFAVGPAPPGQGVDARAKAQPPGQRSGGDKSREPCQAGGGDRISRPQGA